MKFDLFISDFDGTLGHVPDIIEDCTVKAIKDYIKKGGKFAIVSGRHFESIKGICDKYGIECGVVASYQGAVVSELKTGKELFFGGLDYRLASSIIYNLRKDGLKPCAYVDNGLYFEEDSPYIDFHRGSKVEIIQVKDLNKILSEKKKTVLKICGVSLEASKYVNKYNKIYGEQIIANSGGEWLVEVINPNASKGHAVKFIADYYKIPLNRTLAVGDSTNDMELIKGEHYGVAVGDAKEELKKIAKEITVPFKDNPVKVLLEKYCLD